MIISLIKRKFLLKQVQKKKKKYIYEIRASQYCYFGNQNPRKFKLCIKISSAEIF